ncbi:MAG: helix-turn-helix domain-containing protein, partial [Gammaproteobacteria bacterium]|nr:helix-turn-helix domain-containing protein [Gammaproteobacteria bacterium]
VYLWVNGATIKPIHTLEISKATNGAVTPYELRPDVYVDPDWLPPSENTAWPDAVEQPPEQAA